MVWKTVNGAHLVKIADEALKAYDDLLLFPWLTEARPTPSILWTL